MLFRKMLRDMRTNKAQFIAIFLMIFLGTFIYAGINSDWNGMKVSSQSFYDETNLADVWVYGNGFSQDEVTKLKDVDSIKAVERRAFFETSVKNSKEKKLNLFILEDQNLSQMKVMEGESYQSESDGIWIDQSFAKENQLKLGQMYTLEANGLSIEKEIKGFVLHPEMVYQNGDESILPDHMNSGYALVSNKHLAFKDMIPYTQLLIKTDTPADIESVVSDTFERSNLAFIQQKDLLSYASMQSEIEQHQAFSKVFPIVFLLIAVLITITTVSKMIVNQRLQIGILKALGFRNRKVIMHYLSHVVVIASLGAILGYVIGPIIVPALIYPMMESIYALPELKAVALSDSVNMVFWLILACFVVSFIICRKQLKERPADALRPATILYKKKKEQSNKLWNRLNFYVQWNIRDVFRNKTRSLIAILGVAGCMGLMVCALGMKNSMDHMFNLMFHELSTYEMRVTVDESADIDMIKDKMQGSFVEEGAIEIRYGDQKQTAALTVQDDTRYLKLQNEVEKMIDLPTGGIALSYNIAKDYDIAIGDTLSWRLMGKDVWVEHVVKDIIHTPSSQGITMSNIVYDEKGFTFTPTTIVGDKVDVNSFLGVTNVQYLKEDIMSSMDTMLEGMYLLIGILILAAVVLGLVVLYNIGTFSYFEKTREMATLKVLGFRNKQVKKLLSQQNLWLTLLGILFGLPFGYGLIYTVISTIGSSMDITVTVYPITYIGCSLVTLFVSILVMSVVSRKTKHIDMVSALKAME